jgi:hypothetical protein
VPSELQSSAVYSPNACFRPTVLLAYLVDLNVHICETELVVLTDITLNRSTNCFP